MTDERTLCVVVHDVAPGTAAACRKLLRDIAQVAPVPVTLLAVPRYHGTPRRRSFESWLQDRAAHGDEVALHGWTHRDDGVPRGVRERLLRRHYTRSEGEFSGLSFDDARRRIDAGTRWLMQLGVWPCGFVAPAWLLSRGTWQALKGQQFLYTCTLSRLWLLPEADARASLRMHSQVFSSRSLWRRWASIAWNRSLARLQSRHRCVRLELHPADADHPSITRCWQALLRQQLKSREAVTLATAARRLRMALESEQQQDQLGGRDADRCADGDVARIVQAEHDA